MTNRIALIFTAATLGPAIARAQCPNGTPPPCAAARRAAARRTPPAPDQRARHFLVLPFRNVSRGEAQDWLVDGAPLMLTQALGQFHDLAVVSEEQLLAARRRLGIAEGSAPDAAQLRRLADETGGWTAVTGTVVSSGGRVRLSAQALDAVTGNVLVRAEADLAESDDVRPAFDRLTLRLLEVAGLPPQTSDVAALTTRSVDAYRAYVRGMGFLGQSAFTRATAAFREAVRLDSTFALAWARLSGAAGAWNLAELANPFSQTYVANQRAAALAPRLPPYQAALVRAQTLFFTGRLGAARALCDSLIRTEADVIEPHELLALLAMIDPVMDSTRVPARPRGDYNQANHHALDVLERDPGRHYAYSVIAFTHAVAAGYWGMPVGAVAREQASFAATVMAPAAARFVWVLRDSFEVVPAASFDSLPADEQRRLRQHAADAGLQWMQRWLAAGPDDADAHLWASRLADLQGDYPLALREAEAALALGVESPMEAPLGRRVMLLVRNGRVGDAAALADSLLAAGAWRRPLAPNLDRGWSFGVAALLLAGRFGRAVELANVGARPNAGEARCMQLVLVVDQHSLAKLPDDVGEQVLDRVSRASGDADIGSCVPAMLGAAGRPTN